MEFTSRKLVVKESIWNYRSLSMSQKCIADVANKELFKIACSTSVSGFYVSFV